MPTFQSMALKKGCDLISIAPFFPILSEGSQQNCRTRSAAARDIRDFKFDAGGDDKLSCGLIIGEHCFLN